MAAAPSVHLHCVRATPSLTRGLSAPHPTIPLEKTGSCSGELLLLLLIRPVASWPFQTPTVAQASAPPQPGAPEHGQACFPLLPHPNHILTHWRYADAHNQSRCNNILHQRQLHAQCSADTMTPP